MVGIVFSYGAANRFSSFNSFSNSSVGNPTLSSMVGCEHLPLYLSCSGRASQETSISGSCQHAFLASAIVSGFGDYIWDGSPGGAVFGQPFVYPQQPLTLMEVHALLALFQGRETTSNLPVQMAVQDSAPKRVKTTFPFVNSEQLDYIHFFSVLL